MLRRREAAAGRRDLPRQGHARRARRRRHAWLALRLDAQSLRSRAHGRRLVRRPGGLRLGEFRDRRGRAGRARLDPPPVDLDGDHRHAAEHRPRQPQRRLWRLADNQRLARADGAHRHRSRQAARRDGRLRSRRSGHRAWRRPRARRAIAALLDKDALRGARIGILREPMGLDSDPNADDFILTTKLFDQAIARAQAIAAR